MGNPTDLIITNISNFSDLPATSDKYLQICRKFCCPLFSDTPLCMADLLSSLIECRFRSEVMMGCVKVC